MKEKLVLAIAILLLLAAPAVGSVEHRTENCGSDGNDVCIRFDGDDYWTFLKDPNWAYLQILGHLNIVYPDAAEEYISTVHDNGFCNSCEWTTRIYMEMLMHILIGDGDVHYSRFYITRACQETGDCPPLNMID